MTYIGLYLQLLVMIATEFQRLYTHVFGVGTHKVKDSIGILSDVWICRKAKMAAINRKYIGNNVITQFVIYMIYSKEIPTATPMFSGSCNTERQFMGIGLQPIYRPILSDV